MNVEDELSYLNDRTPVTDKILTRIVKDIEENNEEITPSLFSLKELKLFPRSIKLIGKALSNNDKIKELNLSKNFLGTEGASALGVCLSKANLESLDISFNEIYYPGAMIILNNIKETKLKKINFSHNFFGETNGFWIKSLENNKVLEEIDLRYTESDDNVAIQLSSVLRTTNLKKILLSHNNISDDGINRLIGEVLKKKCSPVIDFSFNEIGDEGVKNIVKELLKDDFVEELNLSQNKFSGEGLAWIGYLLKKNKNIKKINISGNNFEDEAFVTFSKAILENITLHELIFSENDNWSGHARASANEVVKHLRNLQVYNELLDSVNGLLVNIKEYQEKDDVSEVDVLKDILLVKVKKLHKIGIKVNDKITEEISKLELKLTKVEENFLFGNKEQPSTDLESNQEQNYLMKTMIEQFVEIQKIIVHLSSSMNDLYSDIEKIHTVLINHDNVLRGGGNIATSATEKTSFKESEETGKYKNGIQVINRPINGVYNLYNKPKPQEMLDEEKLQFANSIKQGLQKKEMEKRKNK